MVDDVVWYLNGRGAGGRSSKPKLEYTAERQHTSTYGKNPAIAHVARQQKVHRTGPKRTQSKRPDLPLTESVATSSLLHIFLPSALHFP